MASAGLFAAAPAVHAQEAANADLQAQIAQAREEIARLHRELDEARAAAATPAAAPAGVAAPEPVPTAAPEAAAPPVAASEPAAPVAAPSPKQNLEDVVVSAKHAKLEIVQDVPQSVSVINGIDLQNQLALDIGAIVNRAANVTFNVGNSRTFSMSIRDVGKVAVTEAMDSAVGVVLDGVPVAYPPFASFDFSDIDDVEVARGPQGTAGGKNFTVGTIAIKTRDPSFTPDASWSIALGQRQTVVSQVAGGGPVIDDLLAWRGALVVNKGAGAYSNAYYPDQTYFNTDRVSGRIKLLFTPTKNFSALATAEIQPLGAEFYNSGVVNLAPPATYANNGHTTSDSSLDVAGKLSRSWFTQQNGGQNFFYGGYYLNAASPDVNSQQPLYTATNNASLKLKEDLGNGLELSSLTATRRYHFEARNDDQTPFNITINSGGKVDLYKEASEELKLASTGGRFEWQLGSFLWYNHVNYGTAGWVSGWGSDAGAYYAKNAQYNILDTTAAGQLLMQNSLDNMNKSGVQIINNHQEALYGQSDWHLTDHLTLTSGLRYAHETRLNNTSAQIVGEGNGAALDPAALGGFTITTGGTTANPTYTLQPSKNNAAQVALANSVAQQYFGTSTFAGLTPGQQLQILTAQAVRKGQIGTVWGPTAAPHYSGHLPGAVLTPSYKFTDNDIGYLALQFGEKGGVAQVVNGVPVLAQPEKAGSVELGWKTSTADKRFLLDIDVFKSIIHNYQQTVSTLDPLNSSLTVTYVGNAPQVNITGFEFDTAWNATSDLRLRASGAYTYAVYQNFPDSPLPAEDQVVGLNSYQSVTGQLLPGASRVQINLGADYRRSFRGDGLFHTGFNTAYLSRYNSDTNLSAYAWIPSHSTTDATIGAGRLDQKFDVSLIAKNLFNNQTPQARTLNSYTPAYSRWLGVQFTGRL